MRLLTIVMMICASLWGGYWYVGSSALETALKDWLADAPSQGIRAEYSTLATRGFPNRFDTTIENVDFADLNSGIGWQAPFFQVFALSYKPYHIIAIWPDTQRITTPGGQFDIASDSMRGSLVVEPNTSLALDRLRYEADAMKVQLPSGEDVSAARVFIATRQSPLRALAHDLTVDITGVNLSASVRTLLDPDHDLPDLMDGIHIGAMLELDSAISRTSHSPRVEAVDIQRASIHWADLSLGVSGRLVADEWGFASGELALTADNWRAVFKLLSTAGLVDPIWEGAIAPLAAADGKPDALNTTLTFSEGALYFGPLALGSAPRLN